MRVLLTGGSGFLGVHCIEALLRHGHVVRTTVRSRQKGEALLALFKGKELSYEIVEDIAASGAFDEAVARQPPLEAVVHTASPFHYNTEDNKRDMLDPAINGTVGLLQSVQQFGKSVSRIVVTSSFAAMSRGPNPPKVYDEQSWNPVTMEEALATKNTQAAYSASKKFAEEAAWEFVKREKPNWSLTVLNPPMIYGPVLQPGATLDNLNTSSARILGIFEGLPQTGPRGSPMYIDVRDLAEAHARSLTASGAAGQRFFMVAAIATDKAIGDIIRQNFPKNTETVSADLSDDAPSYGIDSSKATRVLGVDFRSLESTIVDTVASLKELRA